MTNVSRSKILVLLIGILLLTNLGMLYYFTRSKPHKPEKSKNDRQVEWIKKELGMDSVQAKQYVKSREIRDSIIKSLNPALREAKMKMVELVKQAQPSDTTINAVMLEIMDKQKPIEMAFYDHFRRVKSLCKGNQSLKYDSMLTQMVIRNTGGGNSDKK